MLAQLVFSSASEKFIQLLQCPHIFLSTHFDDSEDNDEGADDGREFWRIDGGFCGQLFSKGKVGRVSKTDEAQGGLRLYTQTIFTFTYLQIHYIYPNVFSS